MVAVWPLFAQDFQLFESGLTNPIMWSLSSYGYGTNATGVFVAIPTSNNKKFFRLKK
jgi:hypothetical protein